MGLKITNASDGRPALWLYGVIGEQYGGISADEVRIALQDIPSRQDIDVHIHSEGGDFWDSIAIHSNLTARQGKKRVIIDSLAASGGSVIAMAGDTIEMAKGGWMMIHEAHARPSMSLSAREFRESADRLDATNDQLVEAYSRRWKGSEKELRKALEAETWLKADAAIAAGLVDTVTESLAIAAYVDRSVFNYANVPEEVSTERLPARHEALREKLEAALAG